MLSFIISRPCLALSSPAARIRPSGVDCLSSRSRFWFRSLFLIQPHRSFTVLRGTIREGCRVQNLSIMIASATTEHSNRGTITQPPAFKTSNTHDPPAKNSAHFITKGLLTVTECRRFWGFRDILRGKVFRKKNNRQLNLRTLVPIPPPSITFPIDDQAFSTKFK